MARCVAPIRMKLNFYRTRPCTRNAIPGTSYCAQHSPEAEAARALKADAAWHRRDNLRRLQYMAKLTRKNRA